jgi:hypothetical protein
MDKSIAELAAMRARGELTLEEYAAARKILEEDSMAPPEGEPPTLQIPESIRASFDQYSGKPPAKSFYDDMAAKQSRKPIVFLGTIALAVWAVTAYWTSGSTNSNVPVATAEDVATKRSGLQCLSKWDGSFRPLVKIVRERLREPSSFEHIKTLIGPINQDGQHNVFMEYRARNGFGGMNVETASAKVANSGCVLVDFSTSPG